MLKRCLLAAAIAALWSTEAAALTEAQIQALINATDPVFGGVVTLPAGQHTLAAPIQINRPLTLRGAGLSSTVLRTTSASIDAVVVQTAGSVTLADFRITSTQYHTAGAGIRFDSAFPNGHSRIERVMVDSFVAGIDFHDAVLFTLRDSYIVNNLQYGVYIHGLNAFDAGDQLISGCVFDRSPLLTATNPPFAAVRQESHGGLKFVGNKIISPGIGLDLTLANSPDSTSILVVSGNSIESAGTPEAIGIRLSGSGGTNSFNAITITGNQVAGHALAGIQISDGMRFVTVASNVFHASGVSILGGRDITVASNTFAGESDGVVSFPPVGIDVAPAAQGVLIGENGFSGILIPVRDAASSSSSISHHRRGEDATRVLCTTGQSEVLRLQFPSPSYSVAQVEIRAGGINQGVASGGIEKRYWVRTNHTTATVTETNSSTTGTSPLITSSVSGTSVSFHLAKSATASRFDGTVTMSVSFLNGPVVDVPIVYPTVPSCQ